MINERGANDSKSTRDETSSSQTTRKNSSKYFSSIFLIMRKIGAKNYIDNFFVNGFMT